MNIEYLIIILLLFLFILSQKKYDNFSDTVDNGGDGVGGPSVNGISDRENPFFTKKNIWGENLSPCLQINDTREISEVIKKEDFNRMNVDDKGYCKMDNDNGANKICVKIVDLNRNFAKYSGYGSHNNWSKNHQGFNSCVNTGTYSLYKTNEMNGLVPEVKNDIVCEAISEDIFLEKYINNWKSGERGKKEKNQIINGIESIMNQCYSQGSEQQRIFLKNKVCNFLESNKYLEGLFYNSPIKLKYCSASGDKL